MKVGSLCRDVPPAAKRPAWKIFETISQQDQCVGRIIFRDIRWSTLAPPPPRCPFGACFLQAELRNL